GQRVVGAGYPTRPEPAAQGTGGKGAVHERRGERGGAGGRGGGQYGSAGRRRLSHVSSPVRCPGRTGSSPALLLGRPAQYRRNKAKSHCFLGFRIAGCGQGSPSPAEQTALAGVGPAAAEEHR